MTFSHIMYVALKFAHTKISNSSATPYMVHHNCMELIIESAEGVPAVAAELDITSICLVEEMLASSDSDKVYKSII